MPGVLPGKGVSQRAEQSPVDILIKLIGTDQWISWHTVIIASSTVRKQHGVWQKGRTKNLRHGVWTFLFESAQSRRHGRLWWAQLPRQNSEHTRNGNMKHYKSTEFVNFCNVKPPCTNENPLLKTVLKQQCVYFRSSGFLTPPHICLQPSNKNKAGDVSFAETSRASHVTG